jgi:hypothetical protein
LKLAQIKEFKSANRIGVIPGLRARDFSLVAKSGFGDGVNAYAHSMAWFRNKLYVGTTRGNMALMRRRLPIGMNPWPTECPLNPFDLGLNSEIWCCDPYKNEWKRVYKAPDIIGSHGKKIPLSFGHRSMLVYDDALHVTTWSPAAGPGPLILRSDDGIHFTPICEAGLIGLPVTAIRSMVSFKGKLYTTPSGSRGGNPNVGAHTIIYEAANPLKQDWQPICDFGFGDAGNKTIFEMAAFGDHLYAGTLNLEGFQIWRSTCEGEKPYKWEKIIEKGAYRGAENQCATSMYAFKGALYVGSGIQGGGVDTQNKIGPAASELLRIYENGNWDLLVGIERKTPQGIKYPLSGWGPGFDNWFAGYFWRMCEHENWLYLSTFDWSGLLPYAKRETWPQEFCNVMNDLGREFIIKANAGFGLYRSYDGDNWIRVTNNGMNNPYNTGLRTMASTPFGLYLGTANLMGPRLWSFEKEKYIYNPRGGCEVFLGNSQVSYGEDLT